MLSQSRMMIKKMVTGTADPYWANTVLLLHGDNGFIDSTGKNTVSAVGNAQISTAQKKYGTGAISLNGSSAYLSVPDSSNFNLGSSDFTLEFWTYLNALPSNYVYFFCNYASGGVYVACGVRVNSNGTITVYISNQSQNGYTVGQTTTATISTSTWNHISLVRSGTLLNLYINGNVAFSVTYTESILPMSGITIGYNPSPYYLNGYIDDLRITKGAARYTPSLAALPLISADKYSMYNVLQLNADDTGTGTFIDSSTNNLTVTKTGTPSQGSFSPFGDQWGVTFNGSTDYITIADNPNLQLGSSDFTVEGWFNYKDVDTTSKGLICISENPNGNSYTGLLIGFWSPNLFGYATSLDGSTWGTTDSSSVVLPNIWNHFAITRSGTSIKIYMNGVLSSTKTLTGSLYNGSAHNIGRLVYSGYNTKFKGQISNLRIVKGTAVYTSNFTVPTSPLTAISGTVLLTCQSNRFIDNSTNNFALTVTGTPQITNQSPFPKVEYIPATHGGSMYFNGTSDGLVFDNSTNQLIGTSDFTIELWLYIVSWPADGFLVQGGRLGDWAFYYSPTTHTLGSGKIGVNEFVSTTTLKLFTWQHIAVTKNSSNVKIYLDGVLVASGASSTYYSSSNLPIYLNSYKYIPNNTTYYCNNYISNLRILSGQVLYTSNFTVPSAPLTAVTNTQLLLSGTNAQLVDKTRTNNLILNGTATVSASQFKYGASSIRINGGANYVKIPMKPELKLGSSDFTIEGWWRFDTMVAQAAFGYDNNPDNSSYAGIQMFINANGAIQCLASTTGTSWTINTTTSAGTVVANTWYHFRVTRTGTAITWYLNGNSIASGTVSGSIYSGNTDIRLGAFIYSTDNYTMNGHIDDFRLTIGKARPVFEVPTEAFPNN